VGCQQLLLAGGYDGSGAYTVQVAYSSITNQNGYLFEGYGSVSPSPIVLPSYPSQYLSEVGSSTVGFTYDFWVVASGSGAPQNAFTQILVEDSTGNIRTYTSASASYVSSGQPYWFWGTGSSPAWTGAASNRSFTIS
jgi:hypothetical protein